MERQSVSSSDFVIVFKLAVKIPCSGAVSSIANSPGTKGSGAGQTSGSVGAVECTSSTSSHL